MTTFLDVAAAQQALDALITDDARAAARWFTDELVFTGAGGVLEGRTAGLSAVMACFGEMSQRTGGTFGTEVEAVYTANGPQLVVVTRHWASLEGTPLHGTQALILTIDDDRIGAVLALSPPGPASGVWD